MERAYEIAQTIDGPVYRVALPGFQLMREPQIFRGTAFTLEQREELGPERGVLGVFDLSRQTGESAEAQDLCGWVVADPRQRRIRAVHA